MNALGAVGTVLWTQTSFDVTERTQLDSTGIVVFAVDALGIKEQIWQGLVVDLGYAIEHCEHGTHHNARWLRSFE